MANIFGTVDAKNLDIVVAFIKKTVALMERIDKDDFKDGDGMSLKNDVSYIELKETIDNFGSDEEV